MTLCMLCGTVYRDSFTRPRFGLEGIAATGIGYVSHFSVPVFVLGLNPQGAVFPRKNGIQNVPIRVKTHTSLCSCSWSCSSSHSSKRGAIWEGSDTPEAARKY